jgi:hypothetical protein
MTVPTIKFEAKKHGLSQVQDGTFKISLTVHPNDMIADFITAGMGQRFLVVLAAIDDDEQPKDLGKETPKRKFADMTCAQQAGILCNDYSFQKWIINKRISLPGSPAINSENAAIEVRAFCGVESRGCLDTSIIGRNRWGMIVSEYRQHIGKEPEIRG